MKVYEAVLDQLTRSGVQYFAGMVGSTSAPYLANLAGRNDARYVGVRHEQIAAAMMDATARLSGRPGCVMAHGGSGLLAASLGVASAALDSIPMILLSLTQERQAMENGWWQTMDVLKPVQDVVKWQTRVERPDQAVEAIRRALGESVTGRPGVAQVDIPIDVSIDDCADPVSSDSVPQRAPLHRPWPEPSRVEETVALLRQAARPVILIGGGARYSGAGGEILKLAEALGCPIVNTPTSRSVVPETHPLVMGPSGIVGYAPIGEAVRQADLILAIGSRLSDLQLSRRELLPADAPIVQVDIEGAVIGCEPVPTLGIVADARAFAECLNQALETADLAVPDARRGWVEGLAADIDDWKKAWFAAAPENGMVQPQEVVAALGTLSPETIFTHGAGDHGFYGYMVPVAHPGAHLVSSRLGAMGCGLGLAMGAKMERPDQQVVACLGDGDLMLQVGDLETMSRERLGAVVVVFNNFRLGSQWKRVEAYGQVMGVGHNNPDFAKLADLFGCGGYRVDRPGQFDNALRDALATGEPALIDVIIDPEARPPRTPTSRDAR